MACPVPTKQQVPDDPSFVSDQWLRRLLKAKRAALKAAGDDPERVTRCVLFYQQGNAPLTQNERWCVLRDLLRIRPEKTVALPDVLITPRV
jgi:hypothetical protein